MNDAKLLVPHDKKDLPSGFQIQRVVDLGARFKGSSTFVEDVRLELPRFYKDVVQNVTNWVAKAPAYREPAPEKADSIAASSKPVQEHSAHDPGFDDGGVSTEAQLDEAEIAPT